MLTLNRPNEMVQYTFRLTVECGNELGDYMVSGETKMMLILTKRELPWLLRW